MNANSKIVEGNQTLANPSGSTGNISGEEELKHESLSPTESNTFSRTSSVGSSDFQVPSSSSAQNTDDEDSDQKSNMSYKDRRREAHTQAEQKRRDAIKRGYDDLQTLVPTCQQPENFIGHKLSKATVLQRSIDYIQYMVQQRKKQEDDLNALNKEFIGLEIMNMNYEKIVSAQRKNRSDNTSQVDDELKFQVFQTVMDSLFRSFDSVISVASFAELSGSILNWIEEYCKPQSLRETTLYVLSQLNPRLTDTT